MNQIENRSKWIGEICVIFLLEWIMILFKLVEPIQWPSAFPGKYVGFVNEFVYLAIEFVLVIVIIAHFIFQISFKDLGLKAFKESIGTIVLNFFYLCVCVGAAYLMSQFSRNIEVDLKELGCQIITNFIAIAFIKELIFRGFLQRAFEGAMKGKKIVASLMTTVFFALTYLPTILVSLNEVSMYAIVQALVIPIIIGFYLSLVYAYGKNIWACTSIHGVLISFVYLEQDFMIVGLEGIYIISLLIYLIFKVVHYYKKPEEEVLEEENEKPIASVEYAQTELGCLNENEDREQKVQDTVKEMPFSEEVCQSTLSNELQKANKQEARLQVTEDQAIASSEIKQKNSSNLNSIGTSASPEQMPFAEEQENPIPNLFEVLSPTSDDEEDLGKIATNLNTKDELEKVVHLESKKNEQVTSKENTHVENHEAAIDDTIVIPKLTDKQLLEIEKKEKKRQKEAFIEAEPNFIAHLETYLGEFEAIYKQMITNESYSKMPIDILYFKGDKVNALVTNGMRGMPMNVPPELKDYQNVELMVFVDKAFDLSDKGLLREENDWIIKLLSDLAIYPHLTNSYLGWGQIVGNGESLLPYDDTIQYCGALVYPPIDETSMKFCNYVENGVNVFIYNVMPLYREELGFIQAQSSEQFINLMTAMGISQCIKKNRSNVIYEMNKH